VENSADLDAELPTVCTTSAKKAVETGGAKVQSVVSSSPDALL
jgi:hypothetical protein